MTEENLQEAIALAREGRKPEARWLLESLLQKDPANETAWLWYADCAETFEERLAALESCLRANPRALRARAGLSLLYKDTGKDNSLTSLADLLIGASGDKPMPIDMSDVPLVAVTGSPQNEPPSPEGVFVNGESGLLTDPFAESPDRLFAEVWGIDDGSVAKSEDVFTVSPESLSEQEFSAVEERERSFLEAHPNLYPLHGRLPMRRKPLKRKEEDWNALSKTGGPRVPASYNAPTQPAPMRQPAAAEKLPVRQPASTPVPTQPRSASYDAVTRPRLAPPKRRWISPAVVVLLVLMLALVLGAVLATKL